MKRDSVFTYSELFSATKSFVMFIFFIFSSALKKRENGNDVNYKKNSDRE